MPRLQHRGRHLRIRQQLVARVSVGPGHVATHVRRMHDRIARLSAESDATILVVAEIEIAPWRDHVIALHGQAPYEVPPDEAARTENEDSLHPMGSAIVSRNVSDS